MTSENFCYWLQGYLELTSQDNLTAEQIQIINDHLALVLDKQTPQRKKTVAEKPASPIDDAFPPKIQPAPLYRPDSGRIC